MKHITSIILFLAIVTSMRAQDKNYSGAIGTDDWTKRWTSYRPNTNNYAVADVELAGVISSSMNLTKMNTYLLKGTVYVTSGATLTIEPGTVIRGDAKTCGTLVITKGSKIMANGTETDPIIFTSNESNGGRSPGDWGGLVLFGEAPINKILGITVLEWGFESRYAYYGGTNEEDNSGSLKYVRIEYSGRKINKSVEINALTLAGVGRGTKVENVQVSYSNDDSFEMFGGSVTLKNIISYKCGDDDLDFNYGYIGSIQNALAIRHPYVSDFSGSRCIEAESYSGSINSMNEGRRFTRISISNCTMVTLDENVGAITSSKEAIYVGPDCYINLKNSIISGFDTAINFKDAAVKHKLISREILIENCFFNHCKEVLNQSPATADNFLILMDSKNKNKSVNYFNKDLFVESGNMMLYNFKLKPMFMVSKEEK